MAHSVYTAIIDLGDVDLDDLEATEEALNEVLFDCLDDSGLKYRVVTAQVVDSDSAAEKADGVIGKISDPSANHLGGFRKDGPETSRLGAIAHYPRSGSHRWKALRAVASAGSRGATYEEVREATGVSGVWKRLSELKQGDWIEPKGTRVVASSNTLADVYVLTEKGRRYVEHKEGIAQ